MMAVAVPSGMRSFAPILLKNAPNLLKKAIVSEAYGPMIEREVIDS
jgi:hypothetical protein